MKTDNILSGVRVLDVGSWVAAPAAATAMADFGADVIKVEPPAGDPLRTAMGQAGLPVAEDNYPWLLMGRNKRSIVLDLSSDEGYEALCRLVETADVFLCNFPPGKLQALRIRYKDLSALNPELIYAQISGYGEEGPDANEPATDRHGWWARSGLMDAVRSGGAAPATGAPAWGDAVSSSSLFGGIMLGLFRRERSGRGCRVSTSLLANGVWANSLMLQAVLCGADSDKQPPRELDPQPLAVPYRCQDERWFNLQITDADSQWVYLLTAIGASTLLDDPRFANAEACHQHPADTIRTLDDIFASKPWAEWRQIFDTYDIQYLPVSSPEDTLQDTQVQANAMLSDMHSERYQANRTISSPLQVEGVSKTPVRAAPEIGQHTRDVLAEAGFSAEEIEALTSDG